MTPSPAEMIEEQALDWLIRLRHADTADWAGFEAWIGRDPAHAQAYWSVAAADAEVAEALSVKRLRTVPPAMETAMAAATPAPRRRFPIPAPVWSIAASVVMAVGGYWALRPALSQPYAIETAAGTPRTVSLADGTRIALNGDTRLLLDHVRPRTVRLDRGEASFTVVHDAGEPFTVDVGAASVRDVGTRFDVVHDPNGLRVAVAEGAVRYEGQGVAQDLRAGEMLVRAGDGPAEVRRIDPTDVAAWRARRLVYDGADVAVVAADLARATGLAVSVTPLVARRPFTGSFALGEGGAGAIQRAADLMGVRAERRGEGWSLTAGRPAHP